MENNPIDSLVEARKKAFENSGNLDLTKEERNKYFAAANELADVIEQISFQKIDETSIALVDQNSLSLISKEIASASSELDWSHSHATTANANLGHLSKLVDVGQKFLGFFKRDK